MKKNLLYISLFISTISLNSCQTILSNLAIDKNINKKKLVYTNKEGKKLVYLPTVHVGKKEYYKSIKKEVDSLRKEGFVVAFEGINFEINKEDYEIYAKKMMRIMGYHVANSTNNEREALPKPYSNKNYLLQSETNKGIIKGDVNFDVSLHELIDKYEAKYGTVPLSDCDLQTPLSSKYDCKQKKITSYYITDQVRNDKVKDKI